MVALKVSFDGLKQGFSNLGLNGFHGLSKLAAGYSIIRGYIVTRKAMRNYLNEEADFYGAGGSGYLPREPPGGNGGGGNWGGGGDGGGEDDGDR